LGEVLSAADTIKGFGGRNAGYNQGVGKGQAGVECI